MYQVAMFSFLSMVVIASRLLGEKVGAISDKKPFTTKCTIYPEILTLYKEKVRDCDDNVKCLDIVLDTMKNHGYPFTLVVLNQILSGTTFQSNINSYISEAVVKNCGSYLEYVIMSGFINACRKVLQIVTTLEEDLISNIKLLLGYAYGKPWYPMERWEKDVTIFPLTFKDILRADNVVLFINVIRDRNQESIPRQMQKNLKLEYMSLNKNNGLLLSILEFDSKNLFLFHYRRQPYDPNIINRVKNSNCKKIRYLLFGKRS